MQRPDNKNAERGITYLLEITNHAVKIVSKSF